MSWLILILIRNSRVEHLCLRFILTGLQLDPIPLGSGIEGKQRGFLLSSNQITALLYAISQKIKRVQKIFH